MVIWDGECTRATIFERPSADVISIEKIASQKRASESEVSIRLVQVRGGIYQNANRLPCAVSSAPKRTEKQVVEGMVSQKNLLRGCPRRVSNLDDVG